MFTLRALRLAITLLSCLGVSMRVLHMFTSKTLYVAGITAGDIVLLEMWT